MTALQLLERLHQRLDLPLSNALAGAVCRSCGGSLDLYCIQTSVPLPHDPSPMKPGYEAEAVRERMKAKLRRYVAERAGAAISPDDRGYSGAAPREIAATPAS